MVLLAELAKRNSQSELEITNKAALNAKEDHEISISTYKDLKNDVQKELEEEHNKLTACEEKLEELNTWKVTSKYIVHSLGFNNSTVTIIHVGKTMVDISLFRYNT